MRILASIAMILSAGMLLINSIEASAHDNDHHGSHTDGQMKKLHAMMPVFSVASAELESALDKGDAAAAKTQADKILAAVPDLKKFRPHKNVKQQKKFVELATNLEETMTSTVDLINKDDIAGAKTVFKKMEQICAACHAKFRD